MWDETSSPGELIHPGELADVASITSSEGELDFAIAVMAIEEEAHGNRGGGDSLHGENGRANTAGRGVWVSQFSANKLGNSKIRESEETEPKMFTRFP